MKRELAWYWSLGVVICLAGSGPVNALERVHRSIYTLPSVDEVVVKSPTVTTGQLPVQLASLDEPAEISLASLGDDYLGDEYLDDHVQDKGSDKGKGKGGSDVGRWRDNVSLFVAGDGWKGKPDDDDNNNFGYRIGFNSSYGIGSSPVRAQLGASFGAYEFFGRDDTNQNRTETQTFVTAGLYQRSDISCGRRVSWGVVWDQMLGNGWGEEGANNINLAQVRFQAGYALSECNELGVWGAIHVVDDFAFPLGSQGDGGTEGRPVRTLDQWNVYWKHNWEYGADTTLYVGLSESPADMVVGITGHAPLSSRVALFGNVHYMIPSTSAGDVGGNGVENSYSEEYWNVSFGIVFYPGAKATSNTVSGNRGLALLPVADNGTFAVKAPLGDL